MKRNKLKKSILIFLAAMCILTLCGCGKTESINGQGLSMTVKGIESKKLIISFSGDLLSETSIQYPDDVGDEAIISISQAKSSAKKAEFKLNAKGSGSSILEFNFMKDGQIAAKASVSFEISEKLKFTSVMLSLDENPNGDEVMAEDGRTLYANNLDDSTIDITFTAEESDWFISSCDDRILDASKLSAFATESGGYEYTWRVTAIEQGDSSLVIISNQGVKKIELTMLSSETENGFKLEIMDAKLDGFSKDVVTESEHDARGDAK